MSVERGNEKVDKQIQEGGRSRTKNAETGQTFGKSGCPEKPVLEEGTARIDVGLILSRPMKADESKGASEKASYFSTHERRKFFLHQRPIHQQPSNGIWTVRNDELDGFGRQSRGHQAIVQRPDVRVEANLARGEL